jgi:glucose-1-phosphate cytidylyltransferase
MGFISPKKRRVPVGSDRFAGGRLMKVVILCGGFGTRIRDVAEDIPKPMIPVGPRPILWHIMKYYASFGHDQFVLCLGYKGQVIKDFFMSYEAHTRDLTVSLGDAKGVEYHSKHEESSWRVTLAETGLRSMTGARVARIRQYVGDDDFMLTYGDGVGDVDLDALLAFHKSHGKALTMTGVRPPGRFGELVAEGARIVEFNEKPQATEGRISGGFFVATPALFDYVEPKEDCVFEREPMARLVADGQMMLYEHDGFWQPMDTNREYELLNHLYEKGDAPWMRW